MYLNGTTTGSTGYRGVAKDPAHRLKDCCKHCPHADKLRLRRLPKWLRYCSKREWKGELRRQANAIAGYHGRWEFEASLTLAVTSFAVLKLKSAVAELKGPA